LDQEGENVALDYNAESGHKHLMLSPPHRANLLNPDYNVIGLGVVRSGDRLYIVQDFGHALPNYSAAEVKRRIAATVAEARHQANQPDLARRDLPTADDAACSMAHADKLGTSLVYQLAQRYTVLTYTSLRPETLPANANQMLSSHNLRSFSVGACYARTQTYPTGVYWVVLSLD
ncbi:MAG: CAP domain-containing protein, partial [Candidatus Sulfotelmatobacter sp.]